MINYHAGHHAEKIAAGYLQANGYRIRALNWKTKLCEIDIVAEKGGVVYFVEAKYRKNAEYGSGFDYITPAKLQRMHFAAEVWVNRSQWHGRYELAAIELEGEDFAVKAIITQLT